MSASHVTSTVRERVATVTLRRPPVNALDSGTWHELDDAFAQLEDRTDVSVIVLCSGWPGIFSAGADVKELPMSLALDETRMRLTQRTLECVLRHPVPILCSVDGPALGGGCALAAACDVRIATRTARFALPEIDVGRCGGTRHLLRHLPPGAVRLAAFTGLPIPAEDAYRMGLVTELVDDADALARRTDELARHIAAKSPTAVRLTKRALDLSEPLSVRDGYEVEQQFSLRLATSTDADEAAAAFREKRPPVWGR